MAGRGASILFDSVNTFGDGDGGSADIKMGSGALARRPQVPPAFGGDDGGGADIEMGNLELVRPQTSAFGGDQGAKTAQGGGISSCCSQAGTTGGQLGNSVGVAIGEPGDDALHFPSDRTTPPVSPGPSTSPLPPQGLTAELTLGPPQLRQLIRTSEKGATQGE